MFLSVRSSVNSRSFTRFREEGVIKSVDYQGEVE